MIVRGKAWKYGDDIDTDQVYPGKYMNVGDLADAVPHLMEGVDPAFGRGVRPGDLIVAGRNFGLGSSRGHVLPAMRYARLGGVVAESFSRLFFRNCIAEGVPVLECPGITAVVGYGDEIEVDFATGEVRNLNTGQAITGVKLEPFMLDKVVSGGTIPMLRKRFQVQ